MLSRDSANNSLKLLESISQQTHRGNQTNRQFPVTKPNHRINLVAVLPERWNVWKSTVATSTGQYMSWHLNGINFNINSFNF